VDRVAIGVDRSRRIVPCSSFMSCVLPPVALRGARPRRTPDPRPPPPAQCRAHRRHACDMFRRRIVGVIGVVKMNSPCLAHRIRRSLPLAGFQPAVCNLRKSEPLTVEIRCLARVSDPEFDVVNAFQLEWIFHPSTPHWHFIFSYTRNFSCRRNLFAGCRADLNSGCGHAVQPVIPLGAAPVFARSNARVSAP